MFAAHFTILAIYSRMASSVLPFDTTLSSPFLFLSLNHTMNLRHCTLNEPISTMRLQSSVNGCKAHSFHYKCSVSDSIKTKFITDNDRNKQLYLKIQLNYLFEMFNCIAFVRKYGFGSHNRVDYDASIQNQTHMNVASNELAPQKLHRFQALLFVCRQKKSFLLFYCSRTIVCVCALLPIAV